MLKLKLISSSPSQAENTILLQKQVIVSLPTHMLYACRACMGICRAMALIGDAKQAKKVSGLVETGLTGLAATVLWWLIPRVLLMHMINSTYRAWWWSYWSKEWPSMLYKWTRKRIADLFVRHTKVRYINAPKEILHHIGGFRAARLPRQVTCTAEPLQVSVSNNHDWPEFYPGNAWVCPALKLPLLHQGHVSKNIYWN